MRLITKVGLGIVVIGVGWIGWRVIYSPTPEPSIADALNPLPSISIVFRERLNGKTETSASIKFHDRAGKLSFQAKCGIKEFGGEFTEFRKKNFRLYFRKKYGMGKLNQPLFTGFEHGIPAAQHFDQLELRSGSHDMKMRGFYLANAFTDDTMLEMGHVNPHGRFVHLYLNGAYWGIYHLRERWNADMLAQYLGGNKEHYEAINGNQNRGGWAPDALVSAYDGDGSAWKRILALSRTAQPSNYPAVLPYLDVRNLVDYMLLMMYGNAEQEFRCAGPKGTGSGFVFHLNDADGFFGNDFSASRSRVDFASDRPGVPGRGWADGPGSLFSALFKAGHPDFRMLVADRIQTHFFNDGLLTDQKILERLDRRVAEVKQHMIPEITRWGGSRREDSYRSIREWESKKDRIIRAWIPGRSDRMIGLFRKAGFFPALEAPTFSHAGGKVTPGYALTLQAPSGVLHFTVDGTDPRLSGGGISPAALTLRDLPAVQNQKWILHQNTWIKARTLEGTAWSGLSETFFWIDAPVDEGDLIASRIHYPSQDGKETGFIELSNASAQPINLQGAEFVSGLRFKFPSHRPTLLAPKQSVLLANSAFAMHNREGVVLPVTALYRGEFNRSDRLTLVSSEGRIILDLEPAKTNWPRSNIN